MIKMSNPVLLTMTTIKFKIEKMSYVALWMSGVIALAIKSVKVETLNANFGVISELELFIGQNKSLTLSASGGGGRLMPPLRKNCYYDP